MAEKTSKLLTCQNRKKGNFITLSTGCLFEMCLCLEVSFCLFILFMLLNCGVGKTLESTLDCKEIQLFNPKGNEPWIKEVNPEYSLEGLLLKLKLQYFGHLMRRTDSFENLKVGERDDRGWDGSMASPTQWTWVWASFRSWWRTGKPGMLQSMGSQSVRHNWATELNWVHCLILHLSFIA